MVRAKVCVKNYETMSKFVKVMPKILWPLFSGHGVNRYWCDNESACFHNYCSVKQISKFIHHAVLCDNVDSRLRAAWAAVHGPFSCRVLAISAGCIVVSRRGSRLITGHC